MRPRFPLEDDPGSEEPGSGVLSGRLHDFCFSSISRRQASCAAKLIISRSLARKLWVEVNSLPLRYRLTSCQTLVLGLVIPAQAGIRIVALDSRLRGNDGQMEFEGLTVNSVVPSPPSCNSVQRFCVEWECDSAAKWRQDVATGASPWVVETPRFRVLKGRHVVRCWRIPVVPSGLLTAVQCQSTG